MDWSNLKKAVDKPAAAPAAKPEAVAPAPAVPKPVEALKETSPSPAVPEATEPPVAEPEPETPAPAPAASAAPLDAPRIWRDLVSELRSQRPLITAWVQSGRLLSTDNDTFLVGFPTDQRMVYESLSKPTNRKLLESLLTKLAGRPMALKMELRDDDGAADHATAPVADTSPSDNGSAADGKYAAAAAAPASDDPTESFKNDPLIQRALRIFEGEIRSVEGPGVKR